MDKSIRKGTTVRRNSAIRETVIVIRNSFSEEYNIKDCNKKIRAFKKENLINALIYTILIYAMELEIRLFSYVK